MDAHRSDRLTMTAIDRELQDLLAIEPSPEFAARVRAQIDVESECSTWLSWRRIAPGLGCLVVVTLSAVVTMRAPQPSGAVVAPTQPAPAIALDAPPPANITPRARAAGPRPQPHDRADEVIMSRDELRGMQQLLAMAAQRDPRLTAMFEVPESSATSPLPAPAPLVIEPLTIEPIAPDSY
jgi:hypothetical protein